MHQRLGRELREARVSAGFSQDYMATKMFVTKRTVHNWENGKSTPDIFQTFEWYRITSKNPITRMYDYMYPELSVAEDDDKSLNDELIKIIKDLPVTVKKMILFLLKGTDSLTPYGIINMAVAHAHCHMFSRVNHAITIFNDYQMYKMSGKLEYNAEVMPDEEMLKQSIQFGIDTTVKSDTQQK